MGIFMCVYLRICVCVCVPQAMCYSATANEPIHTTAQSTQHHTHTHIQDLHINAFSLWTQQASFIKDSYILMQQSGLL